MENTLKPQARHQENHDDSLGKRYFFKLLSNFVNLLIGFFIQAIIPRGLGPKAYGDFSFLTSTFTQITSFLDMGTSVGFYTKLSQRPKEHTLVVFYIHYVIIVNFIVVGFILLTCISRIYSKIWPEQLLLYIFLAAFWSITAWVVQILNQMTDAYGLTTRGEKIKIFQKAVSLIVILVLFLLNKINLMIFFLYSFAMFFILIAGFFIIMKRCGCLIDINLTMAREKLLLHVKEFYDYSHPLFIFSIIILIGGILDRWILQIFSGSIQQGFYNFSYQIGVICILFTSAMSPLLLREYSIAFQNNEIPKISNLFRRYVPLLFSIAAFFSCFFAVQSHNIVKIFGGKSFAGAIVPVMIMAFYPIHQTYGQLSSSVFYATGQTKEYRNIGILITLISLPLTWFLIAPKVYGGIDAGATGLAIKMVLVNFISVNIMLFSNTRFLKLSFWKFFLDQIVCIFILLFFALCSSLGVKYLLGIDMNNLYNLFIAALLYTFIVVLTAYILPQVFGITRECINDALSSVKNSIRNLT